MLRIHPTYRTTMVYWEWLNSTQDGCNSQEALESFAVYVKYWQKQKHSTMKMRWKERVCCAHAHYGGVIGMWGCVVVHDPWILLFKATHSDKIARRPVNHFYMPSMDWTEALNKLKLNYRRVCVFCLYFWGPWYDLTQRHTKDSKPSEDLYTYPHKTLAKNAKNVMFYQLSGSAGMDFIWGHTGPWKYE